MLTDDEKRELIDKARNLAATSYGGIARTLRDLSDALEGTLCEG